MANGNMANLIAVYIRLEDFGARDIAGFAQVLDHRGCDIQPARFQHQGDDCQSREQIMSVVSCAASHRPSCPGQLPVNTVELPQAFGQ